MTGSEEEHSSICKALICHSDSRLFNNTGHELRFSTRVKFPIAAGIFGVEILAKASSKS
ncbi:hypothetical protein GGE29_002005 [Agrobacterium tumefaciens]|nr:hypothetical protein [Agrobacterium radiobacter]MBB4450175.1 hypothetical protein [Agrobacterium radiobacter]